MKDKILNEENSTNSNYENIKELIVNTLSKYIERPKQFKVNEYLTLKFYNDNTHVYINNEVVEVCKYLLIDIPLDKVEDFDDFDSIDEVSEHLDKRMERKDVDIPQEEIFWGHCSNLQAWYENGYDTRLLHSNLAFPLLKKLTKAGDPHAQKVFKNEIAQRFSSLHLPVVFFLLDGGYLTYLSKEEKETLFSSCGIVKVLLHEIFEVKDSPHKTLAQDILCTLIKQYEQFYRQLFPFSNSLLS